MIYHYAIEITIWGILSFLLSILINKYLINNKASVNIKKSVTSVERYASQTKPVFGGITFFAVFLIFTVAFILIMDSNFHESNQIFGIGLVATIAFFMGLADDMLNTPPFFKFGIQVLLALLLIYFNIYIDIFDNQFLNYGLTILWIVGIMNSMNMLDNMDAITSVIALTILSGMFFNIGLSNNYSLLPFLFGIVVVFSSILGFLKFNWSPSKIYMGDNGSQFIGALLGAMSILFIWNIHPIGDISIYFPRQILVITLAFLIPIIDTTTVTINRLLKGQSPFKGGKDHTTHHLSYLGLNDKQIAILLMTISIISVSLSSYIVNFANRWSTFDTISYSSLVFIIFLLLYGNTRSSKTRTRKFIKAFKGSKQ
jgi:UDP-GlcNAc:undecaprenyl-phosphate GlcNAc-1-phosphate transferase